MVKEDIEALKPFHWGYHFDEIIDRGGFDIILTNPPWEIFKPQAKEFFATYSDLVTKNKMDIKTFEKQQKKLLENPEVATAWLDYQSQYPHLSLYFRSAEQYLNQILVVNGKKQGTDINLYKLFLEQCVNLLAKNGECGIVIPSGIYTDLGTKQLREMLFSQTKMTGLFCFENRKAIFEGVDSRFKFVILTFENSNITESFPAKFMRHDVAELSSFPDEESIDINVDLVKHLSPDSLSVMKFKSDLDIQIAQKMSQFPLLGEQIEGKWNLKLTSEFHMTNDSYLFKTEPAKGRSPLFRGKMFHQFELTSETSIYWIDEHKRRKPLLKGQEDNGQKLDYQGYRWVHRRIARNTDSRTLITTITPKQVFTEVNSTTLKVIGTKISNQEMLFLCAVCNSFVLDWMLRQKVTTTLNMFYIYQLPVPRLTEKDPYFNEIVERAAKLICTTCEYDDLAKEVGLIPPNPPLKGGNKKTEVASQEKEGKIFKVPLTKGDLGGSKYGVTDEGERAKIRAELDGMIAHLYSLTEAEFSHILSTFPIVSETVKQAVLNAYRDLDILKCDRS